jgi:ElaB/YqjD/DUF883 family membrane-anchored ribosome-binding protein
MSTAERTGPRAATTDYSAAIDDITARGAAALRGAKTGFDDAVSDATQKGREALDGAREVRDTFADAILHSIKAHPYTTLAIAGAIGFAYGALRRR